jgi:hypothetical protein
VSDEFSVFVVDDDAFVLDVIRGILKPDCAVENFPGVAACRWKP